MLMSPTTATESSIAKSNPNRRISINYSNNLETIADKNDEGAEVSAASRTIAAAAITTVPQTANLKMSSLLPPHMSSSSSPSSISASSSSSLLYSTSALTKFNGIIDNTVSAINCYSRKSHYQHQQQSSLLQGSNKNSSINILNKRLELSSNVIDSRSNSITDRNGCSSNSSQKQTKQQQQQQQQEFPRLPINSSVLAYNPKEINSTKICNNYYNSNYSSYYKSNDNQTKRNDVHYLLKQLNSFSDIEEVEIVDRKMKKEIKPKQHQHQHDRNHDHSISSSSSNCNNSTYAAATAAAFVNQSISSPASPTLSHKIRNFSNLDDNHHPHHYHHHYHNEKSQQYDDYIFRSCDYLESSCFATTITTAIAGSSSHEFRASISTTSMQPALSSQNNSCKSDTSGSNIETQLESIDYASGRKGSCHMMATPVILSTCSTARALPSSSQQQAMNGESSGFLPAISCTGNTTYNSETIISGSGSKAIIQTELSSPLSSSGKNLSPVDSSESDDHRKPFFKCCFLPLDRWREKRNANAAGATAAKVVLSVGQPAIAVKNLNDGSTTIAAYSGNSLHKRNQT